MVIVKRASPCPSISPRSPKQVLLIVAAAVATLLCLLALASYMTAAFAVTYVWQVTTFGELVQPVNRKTCDVRNYVSSLSTSRRRRAQSPSGALRIGLVMLYNDKDGTWDNELMTRVLRNRDKYSRMHNYSIVVANSELDKSRPPAWSKLRALDAHLDAFDYLMYIDMDVVIMNMSIRAEDFIDLDRSKDVFMTEDWNGPNTGVWIVKRSAWTHWFLQTAWNQSQLVAPRSADGVPHPFEYEQRAVHYLLDTKIWAARGLPAYPVSDRSELRAHFLFLPQCAMNSYVLYPFYWKGDRSTAHYIPGDFLVHFAGKKGAVKTNLMEHYLSVAEHGKAS